MFSEEKVIKRGKIYIIVSIILYLLLFSLMIMFIKNKQAETGIIIMFCLSPFVAVILVSGIRFIKQPKKYIVQQNNKNTKINTKDEKQDPTIYQNKGYTYDIACEFYCKQNNKTPGELIESDKDIIWDYVYDDWAYLLAWIIENDYFVFSEEYYGEKNKNNFMEVIHKIKARELIPSDFFVMTDGFLYKDEISSTIVDFIQEYINGSKYSKGKYYVKEDNIIGAYFVELQKFVNDKLNTDIYGFGFKWEEYDEFKNRIDHAYLKYKESNK